MIIVGERINSTRKSIKEAIAKKDASFLIEEARMQASCGAEYIDVNCATSIEKEIEDLLWLIGHLQKSPGYKICIDSPNPKAIEAALKVQKSKPFINSVTAESDNLKILTPVLKDIPCNIIALAIGNRGMPQGLEDRILLAEQLIGALVKQGFDKNNIHVDTLVKPLSTEPDQAAYYLEALKILKKKGIKTIGGLSNVSFGLPKRGLINAVFLKMAMENGIDAAIIDPTEPLTQKVLRGQELPKEQFALAKDVITGKDEYSMKYIKAFRAGILDF